MKTGTPDLLKFKRLERRLKERRRYVVGLLDLLWQATCTNAPQGNIGRFSNEEIAVLCDWEGDPDDLVAALIETGWLDECAAHRLVVHDWHDHAPNYLRGNLATHKKDFVSKEPTRQVAKQPTRQAAKQTTKQIAKQVAKRPTPILTKPNLTIPEDQTNPEDEDFNKSSSSKEKYQSTLRRERARARKQTRECEPESVGVAVGGVMAGLESMANAARGAAETARADELARQLCADVAKLRLAPARKIAAAIVSGRLDNSEQTGFDAWLRIRTRLMDLQAANELKKEPHDFVIGAFKHEFRRAGIAWENPLA